MECSNAVNTLLNWMEENNVPQSEIDAVCNGASTQDIGDTVELEQELGPKEALLTEIGNFLSIYLDIKQGASDYLAGWEDEEIHPLVETGDDNNAASALYFRAESFENELR